VKKLNKRKASKVTFKHHQKHQTADGDTKKMPAALDTFKEESLFFRKK
jgi:hypothetical protein